MTSKLEKTTQLIVYIIDQYPNVNRTQILNSILLLDIFFYNKMHETMFDDMYVLKDYFLKPSFGLKLTQEHTYNGYFWSDKVVNLDKTYYYIFWKYTNVFSDVSIFSQFELDAVNIITQCVIHNRLDKVNRYIRGLSCVSNPNKTKNTYNLDISTAEMYLFELFFGLKVYLTPGNIESKPHIVDIPYVIPALPEKLLIKLPVYVNIRTQHPLDN